MFSLASLVPAIFRDCCRTQRRSQSRSFKADYARLVLLVDDRAIFPLYSAPYCRQAFKAYRDAAAAQPGRGPGEAAGGAGDVFGPKRAGETDGSCSGSVLYLHIERAEASFVWCGG